MAYQTQRNSITTVKARRNQLESAVATAEHFSKHPEQQRNRKKGSCSQESDSDAEDDGGFGFADLVKVLTSAGGTSETDALHEAFKILDCDEDGFITLSDLREAMSGFDSDGEDEDNEMSDEELVDMIAAADEKGNGRISFESFIRILQPNKQMHKRISTSAGNSALKT